MTMARDMLTLDKRERTVESDETQEKNQVTNTQSSLGRSGGTRKKGTSVQGKATTTRPSIVLMSAYTTTAIVSNPLHVTLGITRKAQQHVDRAARYLIQFVVDILSSNLTTYS